MAAPEDDFFRANVGVLCLSEAGLVLAFERADRPGSWQMPQGGLHVGETPLEAARRELAEESGMKPERAAALPLLHEHPEWLVYTLPERSDFYGLGQTQRWLAFRYPGEPDAIEREIDLARSEEFRAFAWMRLAEVAERTAPFRRAVYAKLATAFAEWLAP